MLTTYDNPQGPSTFKGQIDDIKINGNPVAKTYEKPTDYVNTLRGTQSNGTFSRGNNFPAVAVHHGFNFLSPVNNEGFDLLYSYYDGSNTDIFPSFYVIILISAKS